MSNVLDPNQSPSGIDPAGDIKRLTKLPLIIGIIIAAVVIVTLVFAANKRSAKRSNADQAKQTTISTRSSRAGAQNILEGYNFEGEIPPATPSKETPEKENLEQQVSDLTGEDAEDDLFDLPQEKTNSEPRTVRQEPPKPVLSDEEEKRRSRAREFRENLFYDAVVASTSANYKRDNRNQAQGAMGGSGSFNPRTPEEMEYEKELRREKSRMAANSSGANSGGGSGGLGGASLVAIGGGGAVSGDAADPNLRQRKEQFQSTERTFGYSTQTREAQLTPYEIRVGTVIPAVMIGGINSDLPSEIIAQVSQNVRDTRTGQHILIPQGSKLIGTYDSHIAMGQRRVMVGWHRVQFPDGSVMELGNMGGTDAGGYAGFKDKVNNHYWRIFGNATLLSIIGAGAQMSQPESSNRRGWNRSNAREELAAELGRQWGQIGQEMTRRNMDIQPTLEIRSGYRFNVMVNKDLILRPYEYE